MRDLEKKRVYQREHYRENREYYIKYNSEYAKLHRKQKNQNEKRYKQRLKLEVLSHYGGSPPQCACCAEKALEFLTIDHIIGGGNRHRKELKRQNLYSYLKVNNYPLGYRVLCMNCNFAIGHFGYCPHQVKRDGCL